MSVIILRYTNVCWRYLYTEIEFFLVIIGESLCVDPIKNSFKLFEKWNIMECHMEEKLKIFNLKEECDTDEAIKNVINRIATFKWTRNVN